ncbi:MAG: hypothetical protein DMG38_04555 [Acidobacteria bacterium]|nr:MAG: hypothetical protein DMG38_04555 [Acidobacteriota bacterium]
MACGGYIVGLAANKDASKYAVCAEPAGFGGFLIFWIPTSTKFTRTNPAALGSPSAQTETPFIIVRLVATPKVTGAVPHQQRDSRLLHAKNFGRGQPGLRRISSRVLYG